MLKRYTLLFILFSFSQSYAQHSLRIEKAGAGKYKYNNVVKRLHKFKPELTTEPKTKLDFSQFNRARKAQRAVNIVGGSMLAATVGLASIVFNDNDSGGEIGAVIIGVLGGGASGAVLLIGNLLAGSQKAQRKTALIYTINLGDSSGVSDLDSQRESNSMLFPNRISEVPESKEWTMGNQTSKFHLLGQEIMKDDFTSAEFVNFQTYRTRTKRSLQFAYIIGGAVLVSEILNVSGVVNEDTARGSGHRFLTRTLPAVTIIGSLGFAAKFNKQQNKSRDKLIEYVNGYTAVPSDSSGNYWAYGVSNHGLSILYHF